MMVALRRQFFGKGGQATTEMVLLLPIFMLILFFIAKIFVMLVLVQKVEIAAYYAARKYQLQSHRNVMYDSQDKALLAHIDEYVKKYIGVTEPRSQMAKFVGLTSVKLDVERTQTWRIVTLTATVQPLSGGIKRFMCRSNVGKVCSGYGEDCIRGYEVICGQQGTDIVAVKYVPSKDRSLDFALPGLSN
ncbi:MAG: TadE family protein [Elusimicrobiaceae bacterium]|jgi:hypothetical protein